MTYLRNAWSVAALSTEIDAVNLFRRRILDTPVMLYRKGDGEAVAMQDRCPHRFAPLSHGNKRAGDDVICAYHGLRFDSGGRCVLSPHGDGRIPGAAKVRSFPLVERHGFLWIWMGEAVADPALVPDYGPLDEGHPNAIGYTYMHLRANYQLILDNVMDLSHIDHLHGEIITTRGKLSPVTPAIRETDGTITLRWEWAQTPAMLIFANFLPAPAQEARHFFEITYTPPGNIQLSVGANQDGGPLDLAGTIGQYDLHTVTPESDGSTHYFFATRRNHDVENPDYNTLKIRAMHDAFLTEDGPVIEAVQATMGTDDFFGLNPVLTPNDVGAVKMRRLLARLIGEQSAPGEPRAVRSA